MSYADLAAAVSSLNTTNETLTQAVLVTQNTTVSLLEETQALVVGVESTLTGKADKIDLANPLDISKGAALVGFDGTTVSSALLSTKTLATYSALRSYSGSSTSVRVSSKLLEGQFVHDSADTTSTDNGGTVIVGSDGRRWKRYFSGRVNTTWFGTVGDGTTDDRPAFQAAIDFACANNLDLYTPKPTSYYGIRSMSATNIDLLIPSKLGWYGDMGEMRNFCNAHMVAGAVGAAEIVLEGLWLNHNAQAIDDLSSAAVAALSSVDYPNKVYSGYGLEAANNIFGKMFQYTGWPNGTTPDGTTRFCIYLRGINCRVEKCRVDRAQVVAIRFSNGANFGKAINNDINESRFNGINFSDDTTDGLAYGNRITDTLQIGIAVFSSGTAVSDRHNLIGNIIYNSISKPLGENGIEIVGTSPGTISGGVVLGNEIYGYGANGIRTVRAINGTITGNRVEAIGTTASQLARYPLATDGNGIFTHELCTGWVVTGNTSVNARSYLMRSTLTDNIYGSNSLKLPGVGSIILGGVTYGPTDSRTSTLYSTALSNAGPSLLAQRVAFGTSDPDSSLGAAAAATLTITTALNFVRLVSGLTYNIAGITAPVSEGARLKFIKNTGSGTVTFIHSATLVLKGAANAALTTVGSSLDFVYLSGAWREDMRNI